MGNKEVYTLHILYNNTIEHVADTKGSVFTLAVTHKAEFYANTIASVHLAFLSFSSVSYFSRCFTFIVSISVNILSAANPAFWKFFLWKTKFSLSAFWNVSPLVYCKLIITFTMCGLLQAVYKAIANLKYESAFH